MGWFKVENVIAIYAAIIGTIALVWNILDAKKKHKGKFLIKFGFKVKKNSEEDNHYFDSFRVKVINLKDFPRKIRLYGIEFRVQKPKQLLSKIYYVIEKPRLFEKFGNDFAFQLESSSEIEFTIDNNYLKRLYPSYIEQLRIVMIDSTGMLFKSKYQKIWEDSSPRGIVELDASKHIDN